MTRTADSILSLVRAAYAGGAGAYPLARVELHGGDAVGTDAYPALRDARAELVASLRSSAAEVRIAAGYALSFLVEHAGEIQPALDAARADAAFPLERAALIIAAARLRTSVLHWRTEPAYAWDPAGLAPEAAAEEDRVVKAALAIEQVLAMAPWGRKIGADVAEALAGATGRAAGPWGDGDLGRLASAVLATTVVDRGRATFEASTDEAPADDAGADDAADDDDDDDDDAAAAADAPIADRPVDDPYTQERPVAAAPSRVAHPGLREIDWAALEHAYGDARGVPAMIEALGSPDESDRAWGHQALSASINHQGSVYSASAPAVPFLVALVERRDVEDRARILDLLAGLAVGDPSWRLFADLDDEVSPAFRAVSGAAPVFAALLSDPDPEIRTHAAYALSFVQPDEGAAAVVKRALALETDRYARSSLLLALGYVGRRTRSTADRSAIERYLDDDCMLIAASAAIALAQIDGRACAPRVRAVLARTIAQTPPVTGPWPWNDGAIAAFARTVRLAILSVDELLDEADAANARGDWTSARDYGARAFFALFRDGVHGEERLWRPAELDERQRRALRFLVAISRRPEGATAPQFPMDSLDAHAAGITSNVEASRRLIGDASGPLDRAVDLDGRAVPAWFAIDEVVGQRASLEALRTAVAVIPPAERLVMIEDALAGPFGLWHRRAPMDFGSARSYELANDHASSFIAVIAALLEDCALVGLATAQAMAAEQAALARPQAMRCLIAAFVLAGHARASGTEAPPILDRLVFTEQAPVSTYRRAIRAVLERLPIERSRRLLGELPLYGYWAHVDPRGQVRRWANGRGWDLVDLLEPADRIAAIAAAWREWERHRAAGDDAGATPVRGTTTSSIESAPGADQPFPIDRALEVLEGLGDPAAALVAALHRGSTSTTMRA